MKKIAVITALWYEDKFLPSYFSALKSVAFPKDKWMIVLIDNRNSETTRKWIETNVLPEAGLNLPEIKFIASEKNLGFAGGNNLGIRAAKDAGADAVFLLNEDARPAPDFLEHIEKRLADQTVGLVQSFLLLDPPERGANSIGNELHYLGWSYCGGAGMDRYDAEGLVRVKRLHDPELNIPTVSGAALAARTEVLDQVGHFDESYYLYHEDVDLSARVRLAGFKTVIAPESVVYHAYDFSRSVDKLRWMEQNRLRFLLEYYKLPTLVVFAPVFAAAELGLLALSVRNRTFLDRLKAYGYVLNPKNWRAILEKRRRVQLLRKITDREFLSAVTGVVKSEYTPGLAVKTANAVLDAYWKAAKRIISW